MCIRDRYHDGHSIIRNDNSGAALFIASHETIITNTSFDETQAKFIADGAVQLFYNNGKKIETSPSGADVTGTLNVTGISTFGGALSGTTGTFSGDITANGNITGDNSTNITGIAGVTATTLTVSGDVSIADKIVHTGDTDTAIRFSDADTISFETGGTSRVKITSGGELQVTGGTGANVIINAATHDAGTANQARLQLAYQHSGGQALGHMRLDEASTNSFDGIFRIGIPYNNGSGGSSTREVLEADFNGNICLPGSTVAWDTTARTNGLQLYYETDSGQATVGSYSSGGSTHLSLYTNSGGAAATEKLRIKDNGQVLINTTDGTGAYQLVVTSPSGSDTGMSFRGSAASQQRIRFADGTSGGAEAIGQVEYNHADNSLAIDTNGAEAVRIDSSARVMIQTTTEGHTDSDDLTIGDTSDNRIGITIRSSEYGNIFFSDATSGTAEYQGILQYHHTDDVFNLSVGGSQKVTAGSKSLSLFGADNMSSRGGTYYGVDLAYKGSGIQGRSDNPTLDLCSNVSANSSGNGYVYGEGNTTAGQLSVGGNQLIFSSAGSGTAGASATLTEKFRFNVNNTLIFGSTTSNISNGIHLANGMMRFQAANQNSSDFSQQVGIEWSQESGSDVQVGKIVMRRDAWGGAPHNMDFWTRTYSNNVQRALILHHNGNATLTGTLTQSGSDIRLKENITQIPNALTKVNSLTGFTFNWNKTCNE